MNAALAALGLAGALLLLTRPRAGAVTAVSPGLPPPSTPIPKPPAAAPAPTQGMPFPTTPSVPTEPPKPRATPKTFKFKALHRYSVVVDVLPVKGVGLKELARAALPILGMSNPDFDSAKPHVRDGREVTRVAMDVNSLMANDVPMERERALAGVGSIWLISALDRGSF